jgi:hypothetical protein
VSETKSPYYHGIVLLQLYEADIGCNNENLVDMYVLFHLASVLPVLRFTDSNYPFGLF